MRYSSSGDSLIYQKNFDKTKGLINYWSFNENVNDVVGNANLYEGHNACLTIDRFGIANSALSLASGYYKVPPGVYFSGTELTIMGWVKVKKIQRHSRLIDFGNGQYNDNIAFSLSFESNGNPYLFFNTHNEVYSFQSLNLTNWQHLACVFSFPNLFIYIDGNLVTSTGSKTQNSFSLANVVRNLNFIGRSNWFDAPNPDADADADFDDLKLFNRALSQQEIQWEMNNNL